MVKKITIGKKSYDMIVGIGLLADLNDKYAPKFGDRTIGSGIGQIYLELNSKNPLVVYDMIKFGTQRNPIAPTEEEIEKYIFDNMKTEEKAGKMFENFLEYFKTLPGADLILNLEKKMEEIAKSLEV